MELVAFIGSDKENWGQITALLKRAKWNRVLLVKNNSAPDFPEENAETIIVNSEQPMMDLKQELLEKLKSKLGGDFEVALSLASGTGKEHMALIAALLSIPVGVRLVVFTKEGVQTIN